MTHPGPERLSSANLYAEIKHGWHSFKNIHTPALRRMLTDESGQDLIEYALVAALVGLGVVGAMKGLKNSIGSNLNSVGNSLTSSVS